MAQTLVEASVWQVGVVSDLTYLLREVAQIESRSWNHGAESGLDAAVSAASSFVVFFELCCGYFF